MNIILTCEHGGNELPPKYVSLFVNGEIELASHRGWDPGSLQITEAISKKLAITPYTATVSRLLVDLNRSLDNPTLFSEFVPEEIREGLLRDYYYPYRTQVEIAIQNSFPALHLSIHTFTPNFNGEDRETEIGILFDPSRPKEVEFAESLLPLFAPHYRTHLNSPYLGIADGFTTHLRTHFADPDYAGIELEFSQAIAYDENLLKLIPEVLHCLLKS